MTGLTVIPRTRRTRKHGARQAHDGPSSEPIQGITQAVSQEAAAAKTGISVRSARRVEQTTTLPSQRGARRWRTRADPLAEAWETELVPLLRDAGADGGDAARGAAAALSRAVRSAGAAHAAAAGAPVARAGRRGARSLLRPGAPAGALGAVRLHRCGRARGAHRRRAARAPALSVRARPLGLAPRRGRAGRGELGGALGRAAERAVAARGRAGRASHRQSLGGVQQSG